MSKYDYKVLGLQSGATQEEIRQAYRKKALKKHPDKGGNEKDFQELNAAYERLKGVSQSSESKSRPAPEPEPGPEPKPKPKPNAKALALSPAEEERVEAARTPHAKWTPEQKKLCSAGTAIGSARSSFSVRLSR